MEWPKDRREPVDFDDLARPVVDAIKSAYDLKRKNRGRDIPWTGPPVGKSEAATCCDHAELLSAEGMGWQEDDQGFEAIEVIVAIALRLGIEQGRRVQLQRGRLPAPLEEHDVKSPVTSDVADKRRSKFEIHLIMAFAREDVSDGMDHPATDMIHNAIKIDPCAADWVRDIVLASYYTGTRASIPADTLTCVSRIPRALLGPKWCAELVRDALKSENFRLRDAAVVAAEQWGGWTVAQTLREHDEPVDWLREYIERIIVDLDAD